MKFIALLWYNALSEWANGLAAYIITLFNILVLAWHTYKYIKSKPLKYQ